MFNPLRVIPAFMILFAVFVPRAATATIAPQSAPAAPQAELGGLTEIALGSQHTCAVVNGGVKCWGNNQYGQVGDGTTQNRNVPAEVVGLGANSGVTHIWAGEYFTCAIIDKNNDGLSSVKCWGRNDSGQLGDGTFITRSVPAFVVGSEGETWNITSYSGVSNHSCVKFGDDPYITQGLLCWGANESYQLGNGTSVASNLPTTATNLLDMPFPGGVRKVTTGKSFTCALGYASSDFQCLGANGYGQLGNGTTQPSIVGVETHHNELGAYSDMGGFLANGSHICGFNLEQRADTGVEGLTCWGANEYGQVGIGNTQNVLTPTAVYTYIQNMPQNELAVGEFHTCIYNSVYYDPRWSHMSYKSGLTCWGLNNYGQLGDGTATNQNKPTSTLLKDEYAREVKAGGYHTCMLTSAGKVLCWGRNDSGQLGDGTFANKISPVQVLGLPDTSGVSELALGSQHTCAVVSGGVKCWGNNQYGQVGDGTTQNRNVPVDVVGLGAWSGVTHIWAGEYFTCAIIDKNNDGLSSVKCWGRNDSGQLGDGTFITSNKPAFVRDSESETWEIGSYSGVGSHSCIKLGSPDMTITVLCWGLNATYQLGDGTSVSANHPVTAANLLTTAEPNAFKIATGGAFSCVQGNRSFRDIRCLGANGAGQLGNGTTIPSISGTWVVLPYPYTDDRLMDFAANGSHACLVEVTSRLDPSGVFCWGYNAYGQVGISSTQNVLTPTRVVLPGYIVGTNLAMGEFHTCNYRPVSWYDGHFPPFASDSYLTCWGRNDYGQLGDGTTTNRLSPVQTPMAHQRFRQVAAGGYHTCAITDLDAVWCWGRNDSGQLGDGTLAPRSSPVAVAAFPAITETTIVVTSFDDSNGGGCTLRNALRAVDNRWSWYGCPPALGNVTIQIPEGVYTNVVGSSGYFGGLTISNDVTIKGAGADKTTITVSPDLRDRVMRISASPNVTISDLTLRGGQSPTDTQKGGGILNSGFLTLTNVLITGNMDGGIVNTGTLLLMNSTVMNNTGGGLINTGPAVLVNSTFSNNTANTNGAEIRNESALAMTSVTLNHTSDSIASLYSSGQIVVGNSIINSSGGCVVSGPGGISSLGHNLVNSAVCQTFFMADGDLRGVDPRLGPINQNAPGHTPTHALLPGSAAIDTGVFVGLNTDQRGVARPQGAGVDIGAYEYRPIWDAPARVFLPSISK